MGRGNGRMVVLEKRGAAASHHHQRVAKVNPMPQQSYPYATNPTSPAKPGGEGSSANGRGKPSIFEQQRARINAASDYYRRLREEAEHRDSDRSFEQEQRQREIEEENQRILAAAAASGGSLPAASKIPNPNDFPDLLDPVTGELLGSSAGGQGAYPAPSSAFSDTSVNSGYQPGLRGTPDSMSTPPVTPTLSPPTLDSPGIPHAGKAGSSRDPQDHYRPQGHGPSSSLYNQPNQLQGERRLRKSAQIQFFAHSSFLIFSA